MPCFRRRFDEAMTLTQKSAHVLFQEEDISKSAEGSQGRLVIENFGRNRFRRREAVKEMIMIEAMERTSYLGIAEMERTFEGSDAAR